MDRDKIRNEQVYLINDSFQNRKQYNIPKAQLVLTDIPYNLSNNAYASNPQWYVDGDNTKGESKLANSQFFDTDKNFNLHEFFHFCSKLLKPEPKEVKNTIINVGQNRAFTTIQDAINSITAPSEYNRYSILVDIGVYDITNAGIKFIPIKPYVTIKGVDKLKCIISFRPSTKDSYKNVFQQSKH